jgi:FKBP12-rapamycin complex-associated protein
VTKNKEESDRDRFQPMPEILNEKALNVMKRVDQKLTGKDFGNETLDIPKQIQRLIKQATSHENLCQCYIGWLALFLFSLLSP